MRRARPQRWDGPGGAGLGLSIVHSICTAHGAEIEVREHRGLGSCFRLKFPRPPSLPAPPSAPCLGARPRRTGERRRSAPRQLCVQLELLPTEASRLFQPDAMMQSARLPLPDGQCRCTRRLPR